MPPPAGSSCRVAKSPVVSQMFTDETGKVSMRQGEMCVVDQHQKSSLSSSFKKMCIFPVKDLRYKYGKKGKKHPKHHPDIVILNIWVYIAASLPMY